MKTRSSSPRLEKDHQGLATDEFFAAHGTPVLTAPGKDGQPAQWRVEISNFTGLPYIDRHWKALASRLAEAIDAKLSGDVVVFMGCRSYSTRREPLSILFHTLPGSSLPLQDDADVVVRFLLS